LGNTATIIKETCAPKVSVEGDVHSPNASLDSRSCSWPMSRRPELTRPTDLAREIQSMTGAFVALGSRASIASRTIAASDTVRRRASPRIAVVWRRVNRISVRSTPA
jgi:hypothetical protein